MVITDEPLELPFDTLSGDALRLLHIFEIQKVRFLIVGGYAVRVHGCLRAAADLDLLIDTREKNVAHGLYQSLTALGVREAFKVIKFFLSRTNQKAVWRWKDGNIDYDVDLLTALESLTYDDLAPTAIYHQHEQLRLPVISKQKLIEAKQIVCKKPDRLVKDLDDLKCLMGRKRYACYVP